MGITVRGITVEVGTPRLQATFEGPKLVRLCAPDGRPLLQCDPAAGPPGLEISFQGGETVGLGSPDAARVQAVQLGRRVAQVAIEDLSGDASLRISIDERGRLVVEPAAQTLRHGLAEVRWNLAGIAAGLKLVAPFFQGCRQDLEHPLVAGTYAPWPHFWEAALAVLQGPSGGWSVRCHDPLHRPKAIKVGHAEQPRSIGLGSSALGPQDRCTAVGSVAWIVDSHDGDWQTPAEEYRRVLREEIGHDELRKLRPEWASEIRLTLQWAPCKAEVLQAVGKIIDPRKVLVHVPSWRRDAYDENYPEYVAGEAGAAFIAAAQQLGFRIMPHFNYFAIDPNHPLFARVRDHVMREARTRKLMGWRWKSGVLPFPQGHGRIADFRSTKAMAYLHTGLSLWRRELVRRIGAAAAELRTPALFVDQTLCTFDLDNALVENLTCWDGMVALTRELTELDGPPAVGGEGLNELSMRYQTFAQAHLFKSWHANCANFEQLDPVPVGDFLYGDLCRTMGYANLSGRDEASALRLLVHEKLNALPSLTVREAEEIENPCPAVRRVLDRATG